jgi:hypothetical protein
MCASSRFDDLKGDRDVRFRNAAARGASDDLSLTKPTTGIAGPPQYRLKD